MLNRQAGPPRPARRFSPAKPEKAAIPRPVMSVLKQSSGDGAGGGRKRVAGSMPGIRQRDSA